MGLSGELSPQIVEPFVHQFDDVEAIKGHNSVRGVSARKGHRCVTVVLDAESHDLLLMVEGRHACPRSQGRGDYRGGYGHESSYIAGVQAHFPNARIVFDLFHIMKLAGEALDAVRKSLRMQGADLTGGALGAARQ
jgi:transposase